MTGWMACAGVKSCLKLCWTCILMRTYIPSSTYRKIFRLLCNRNYLRSRSTLLSWMRLDLRGAITDSCCLCFLLQSVALTLLLTIWWFRLPIVWPKGWKKIQRLFISLIFMHLCDTCGIGLTIILETVEFTQFWDGLLFCWGRSFAIGIEKLRALSESMCC